MYLFIAVIQVILIYPINIILLQLLKWMSFDFPPEKTKTLQVTVKVWSVYPNIRCPIQENR